MSNLKFIYIVDVEHGVEAEGIFTPTSQEIKAFGGDKSLFDFIAKVVDTKHELNASRIAKVTKYTFGGTFESFNLAFNNGNLELISTGTVQADAEVVIPEDIIDGE